MVGIIYSRRPKKCPQCGSNYVANNLYGRPTASEELEQNMQEVRIASSGRCIGDDDPD